MTFKTTKLDIIGGLELKEATFQNKCFPTHFHDTYSIGIIKEGIEHIIINNKNLITPAKSVVVINQYEAHSNQQYDNDKWTYLTIYLDIDALHYLNRINELPTRDSYHFQNIISNNSLYTSILQFHENEGENKEAALQSIAHNLLNHYLQKPDEQKQYYPHKEAQIEEAKHFFSENFIEKINIGNYATKLKMNDFQFIRAFKAQTGLTPISYITLLRLNQAKKLIIKNTPMVEVALDCGFYDQSHFTNNFSKFFGISPLGYKNSFRSL